MSPDLRHRAKRLGITVRRERNAWRVRGRLLDGRRFSVKTSEVGVVRIVEAFEACRG
jgi:hypothetical protein